MPMQHLDADAQAIVKLSNEIAYEFELDFVGTEHILLAILRYGGGVGAEVLRDLGLTEQKAREILEQIIQREKEDTWVFGRLPGSPHFRNVMAEAIEEANALDATTIRSEHLLLALLREAGSTADRILSTAGISKERCLDAILKRVDGPPQ